MSENITILIVDDQPQIRLPLQYLVSSLPNVTVVTGDNGRQAIELAKTHRPALTLLDVMMPEVDGYTACKEIRQALGESSVEVWFITARGSSVDEDQAKEVGAKRTINKPFDPDAVIRDVRAFIEQHRKAA